MNGVNWGEVMTQLLVVSITVFLPVILGMLVAWVRPILQKMDEKIAQSMGEQQWTLAKILARQFVQAAEQQGIWDSLLAEGVAKKRWVRDRLDAELRKQGIILDWDAIDAAIESAVYDMNIETEPVEVVPETDPYDPNTDPYSRDVIRP